MLKYITPAKTKPRDIYTMVQGKASLFEQAFFASVTAFWKKEE
jgi:hypothetical protein